jgi:hypothetical protein
MNEANTRMRIEKKEGQTVEPWMTKQAREVLMAMGKLHDFEVSDMNAEELADLVRHLRRSRRMREADLLITQENHCSTLRTGKGLVWDEVMK